MHLPKYKILKIVLKCAKIKTFPSKSSHARYEKIMETFVGAFLLRTHSKINWTHCTCCEYMYITSIQHYYLITFSKYALTISFFMLGNVTAILLGPNALQITIR